jgi:beta-mannosidase
LNGIDIHAANDRSRPIEALLRVALYRGGEQRVAESERAITIPAHETLTFGVEQMLGRFVDAACAYRFGPPGHTLIAAGLHRDRGDAPFSQSFHFPAGRSLQRMPISDLGMVGQSKVLAGGAIEVVLSSRRFAWGVRVAAPGFLPDDAYFGIEPGGKRRIVLSPVEPAEAPARLAVTAINAEGRFPLAVERMP